MVTELSMLTALAIIIIILLSGGSRLYFKRKFDVSEHIAEVAAAAKRNQAAKQRLHNVSTR